MKTLTKILIVLVVITVALVLLYSDYTEKVSNFKIIAWSLVLLTALAYNFESRRWYYSRKAVFYADAEAENNEGNRAITLAPGPEIPEGGYFWTYEGFSALLSSSPPYEAVIVSLNEFVHPGRNIVFKGERAPVNREQLLEYLRGNRILHQKILSSLLPQGKVYVILRLPWIVEKNSYSLKGGYPIGTDKFVPVMKILYRHKMGLENLSKAMTETFEKSMDFSQNTMQYFRRISTDVQTARKTEVPQAKERPVQLGKEQV